MLNFFMKVAYLGPIGTFSHSATKMLFPNEELIAMKNIYDIFDMVENEKVDAGVVPVENSTDGSIRETLDILTHSNFKIVAEKQVKIEHCLMAKSKAPIKMVVSHPQAIAQCQHFLISKMSKAKLRNVESTAKAAEIASKNEGVAAIASKICSKIYDLEIIVENIQDYANNYTRFFVISKKEMKFNGNKKTSVIFSLKNVPGALYNALKIFAERNINLTKIESRPSKTSPWEYLFFLDFEGDGNEKQNAEALELLNSNSLFFKNLGTYPVVE